MYHQLQTLDSPSVITFSTERPQMLIPRYFIAQNAPTESCRCTIRIPWYHQNPAYTHIILFALTAWETPILGQIRQFLEPCDLQIWEMTLKNNRAPRQCYFTLCASFGSHLWIQPGVTVRKRPIWVTINDFLAVWLAIWRMALKNNIAPLLCCFKLCA